MFGSVREVLQTEKTPFYPRSFMVFQKLQDLILQEIIERLIIYFVVVVFFSIMSPLDAALNLLQEKLLTQLLELNTDYRKI